MDFPGNTNKGKEEKVPKPTQTPKEKHPEKKVEKVVTGEVIQQKKTIGYRMRHIFFGGEFKAATRYITAEVLLPALRNLIVDATSKGIERVVYGENMRHRGHARYEGRVSYNTPLDRGPYRNPTRNPRQDSTPYGPRRSRDINSVVLNSREEAEIVVERLIDIIEKFECASVADFHDLLGLPTTYVDNNWGWTSLHFAEVRQVRHGYMIDLPPVEPL